MKALTKVLFIIFSLVFIFYLILPNPSFPEPLPDALQSNEPADTESPLRRAYFTNYTRQEVLEYYQKQFDSSSFYGLPLPAYRLNYPPEESWVLIRDQTRSTFLEEIAHPFRESLFVNGFEPKDPKDAILIEGKSWRQKITVRFVPSKTLTRTAFGILGLILICTLFREWSYSLRRKHK